MVFTEASFCFCNSSRERPLLLLLLALLLDGSAPEVLLPLPELGWRLVVLALPEELETPEELELPEEPFMETSSFSSSFSSFFSVMILLGAGAAGAAGARIGKASGAPIAGGPVVPPPPRRRAGGGVRLSRNSFVATERSELLVINSWDTKVPRLRSIAVNGGWS